MEFKGFLSGLAVYALAKLLTIFVVLSPAISVASNDSEIDVLEAVCPAPMSMLSTTESSINHNKTTVKMSALGYHLHRLGVGSHGTVYRAVKKLTGDSFILKIYHRLEQMHHDIGAMRWLSRQLRGQNTFGVTAIKETNETDHTVFKEDNQSAPLHKVLASNKIPENIKTKLLTKYEDYLEQFILILSSDKDVAIVSAEKSDDILGLKLWRAQVKVTR